ncbi:MFS transporter [Hyphococcus sp. DH-69]|uniref:MFS transporter n=1 Tax=Hyphococcus formosus TaxID=3143534 RepID=UPI00398B9D17
MTNDDTLDRNRRLPTAAPDGFLASIILSFLATAGLFYVNIMAAIVDGLVAGLGISESAAGNIGAANIYGAAFGALGAVLVVKQVPWRLVSIISLLTLVSIDLASMFITSADILLLVRLIHGIVGGLLVGVSYAVIARTNKVDRTFGVLLFVQFGLGGLGVMVLPRLVPIYGVAPLFIALALFSAVALAMLPFLGRYPPNEKVTVKSDGVAWRPLVMTLIAIFLFQAANMGLLAYIIRLGISFGLDRNYVSTALGLATWVALAGPAIVIVLGVKYGRFPVMFAGMLLTLGGTAVFHLSAQPAAYMIANCGTGITWGAVVAYLLGMAAQFDKAGRTAAAAGFVSKLGLASGPFLAGQFLASGGNFPGLINAALLLMALSMLVMLPPAKRLDEAQPTP